MAETGRFRKRPASFTMVSNTIIDDENISFKAKGLYMVIERYLQKDGWILYKSYLMNNCKEGETAFNSAWKELKDNGYLKVYKLRDEKTRQWYYEYELLEEPEMASEGENATPTKSRSGYCSASNRPPKQNTLKTEYQTNINPPTPTEEERERENAEKLIPEAVRNSHNYGFQALKRLTAGKDAETVLKRATAIYNEAAALQGVKSPWGYYCTIVKSCRDMTTGGTGKKPGANFHNFQQRTVDYDALLKGKGATK